VTRESDIEAYFVKRVKEAGGLQRKFISPGVRGVPDRIAIFEGRVMFVELKAPGKFLRADQIREHDRLRAHGADTYVIDCEESVDYFIEMEMTK
jgi:hypothetical protein